MLSLRNKESLSTIHDECSGVGHEIGTCSKQKTSFYKEDDDIVSSHGDMGL